MQVTLSSFSYSEKFKKELAKAKPDIQAATRECLEKLKENSDSGSLRLHPLKRYKPLIFKIDVLTNHSWQLSFEFDGANAHLLRLCTHREMNRAPK